MNKAYPLASKCSEKLRQIIGLVEREGSSPKCRTEPTVRVRVGAGIPPWEVHKEVDCPLERLRVAANFNAGGIHGLPRSNKLLYLLPHGKAVPVVSVLGSEPEHAGLPCSDQNRRPFATRPAWAKL